MSILKSVQSGIAKKAQIHVLYSIPGIGKSTFASKFPNPIFLDLEHGSFHLDVKRISDLKDFKTFRSVLKELIETNHDYKTVVIDSVDVLESLISDFVCEEGSVETVDKYDGGFGKGWSRIRELMREVMGSLRTLAEKKNITVVIIGHSQVKQHNDPTENVTYDRYSLKLNEKTASLVKDLADSVFFATHKVFTTKENGKTKAFSDGERVMFTSWRAAYDAKNRIGLPHELPLDYDAFKNAIDDQKPQTLDQLKEEIVKLSAGLDKETKEKALESMSKATSIEVLRAIKSRVETLVNS